MCGIFGQFNPRGAADPALIERMAHCLDHRGPDGYGTYHHGPLAFGAGRLAIIDLAAGVQPIFNEDHTASVVFNGEIYNYKPLRAELEAKGHVFTTGTDTEVIIHGYEEWGDSVVDRLRGMFGLGVWDESRERLLLARDRAGEKPLYYTTVGGEFLFASEIKALFEHPAVSRAVNMEGLLALLALGYAPPPMTIFAGINKLAPGERLIVDRNGSRVERYWQPTMNPLAFAGEDYPALVQRVRELLIEVVEMRMMSDVPIGVFLSGGVDSTTVAAIVGRAAGRPVESFTVGFDMARGTMGDTKFNADARYAEIAVKALGTNHHAITVPQDERLAALLPHLIAAMDEPIPQHSMIQTAYVAALARVSGVPVLLSGDAGDELFGGYNHYRADVKLERYLKIAPLLRKTVLTPLLDHLPFAEARKLAQKSRRTDPVKRYLEWLRIVDPERFPELLTDPMWAGRRHEVIERSLRPLLNTPQTDRFADRIAYTSLRLWVAEDSNMRVDKMSMAMSIEARAPLEDHHLIDLALSIPLDYKLRNGGFKTVMKDAVADLVPAEILARPKWGFTPPTSDWLRTILRPLVDRYLSREYVEAVGIFQPDVVAQLVDDHMNKRAYELWTVWPLLVFHLWHALYIDGSLRLDHKITPEELAAGQVVG